MYHSEPTTRTKRTIKLPAQESQSSLHPLESDEIMPVESTHWQLKCTTSSSAITDSWRKRFSGVGFIALWRDHANSPISTSRQTTAYCPDSPLTPVRCIRRERRTDTCGLKQFPHIRHLKNLVIRDLVLTCRNAGWLANLRSPEIQEISLSWRMFKGTRVQWFVLLSPSISVMMLLNIS